MKEVLIEHGQSLSHKEWYWCAIRPTKDWAFFHILAFSKEQEKRARYRSRVGTMPWQRYRANFKDINRFSSSFGFLARNTLQYYCHSYGVVSSKPQQWRAFMTILKESGGRDGFVASASNQGLAKTAIRKNLRNVAKLSAD